MSIPSRRSSPEQVLSGDLTFFVTSACFGHRAILQSDRNAHLLQEVLQHYRRESKYRLHAFVIMPDHFHAMLTVSALSIERAVQMIKWWILVPCRQGAWSEIGGLAARIL